MKLRIIAGLLACLAIAPVWADGETAATPQPKVGEIPPDALGRDRQGKDITVSQYRGKVVIVTFWASWCGPCRKELPILGKVQKIVGREHLEVVAVNFKEDRDAFNAVVRANHDIALHYVPDPRGRIGDSYGVKTIPNMFIIDTEGRIAHVHRGYSEDMLDGFVQEMLQLLPKEALERPVEG
jgi:thiol-disulfide isomerase/thioredoxin